MPLTRVHLSRICLAWLSAALLGSAQAQGFNFKLPADYGSRFGATSAMFDTTNSLYGVRYLPLPTPFDLRVFYVAHPAYTEYGLYSRLRDTDVLVGNFDGGASGIRTAKLDHNPDQGAQATTLLQGSVAPGEQYLNYSQFGYAQRWQTLRLFGAAGYGFNGGASAAYLNAVISGGHDFALGHALGLPGVKLGISFSSRLWLYPVLGQLYSSTDFYGSLGGQLSDRLTASVSHLERVTAGNDVLGFGYGAYRESRLSAVYQPKLRLGPVSFRSAQFNAYRIWGSPTDPNNIEELSATLRADIIPLLSLETTPAYDFYGGLPSLKAALLLKLPQLPSAVGPSLKYTWKPTGSDWTGNVWQFGLVITAK